MKLIQIGSKYFERGVRESEMSDEEREEMDDTASMAAAFDLEHIP